MIDRSLLKYISHKTYPENQNLTLKDRKRFSRLLEVAGENYWPTNNSLEDAPYYIISAGWAPLSDTPETREAKIYFTGKGLNVERFQIGLVLGYYHDSESNGNPVAEVNLHVATSKNFDEIFDEAFSLGLLYLGTDTQGFQQVVNRSSF